MPKFRQKSVEVEAVQWCNANWVEVFKFCPIARLGGYSSVLEIVTREGTMLASDGDWIIKGIQGEFYPPCKPDIFEATYEPI